jgi:hypothetical protein
VVAKVELHYGELSPRVGFIVTSLDPYIWAIVWFHNQWGGPEGGPEGGPGVAGGDWIRAE